MSAPPNHKSGDNARLEKTKMSFGEHLEELRGALFKSLTVTVIGFLIGLTMGWNVVHFIQIPLRTALETYYRNKAEVSLLERLEEKRRDGLTVPDDLEAAAAQMAVDGLVPHAFYFDPIELRRAFGGPPAVPGAVTSPSVDPPVATAETSEDQPTVNGNVDGDPLPNNRSDLIRLNVYQPLEEDVRVRVVGLSVQEGFMVYVKASLVAGVLISSPFIFYFIWDFVAAGLYHHEKKHIYIYLPLSLGLFLSGAALAFFVVFDYVLNFLLWFNYKMDIDPDPRISEWISFVLMLPLGFGVSFQLPLVMLFLERIGVFTVEAYLQKWRIAVLVISVLSMFLTPADPGSMLLMGIPLVVLYFGGIALCHYIPHSKASLPEETTEANASGS